MFQTKKETKIKNAPNNPITLTESELSEFLLWKSIGNIVHQNYLEENGKDNGFIIRPAHPTIISQ